MEMENIQIKHRKGDSLEYGIFEECIKLLNNPVGATMEIGVRDGFGSAVIINAWRNRFSGSRPLVHFGVDPYGNISYNGADNLKGVRYDYTNEMKQDMLIYMSKFYPEFHFINLDDKEFFGRFVNGYPIYRNEKILINQYDLIHLDGPHDTESVVQEVDFVRVRAAKECFIVLDDCQTYDLKKVVSIASNTKEGVVPNKSYNFNLVYEGERKAVLSNFHIDNNLNNQ